MIDFLDSLVVELQHRAEASRAPASDLMRDLFREHTLRPRQQKRVKEMFHRVLASRHLIDRALREATPDSGVARQIEGPVRVLISRVLSGDLSPKAAAAILPWVDWVRVQGMPSEIRTLADPLERIALIGSIPRWLAQRLHHQYGDAADELVAALTGKAPVTIRANTLRCTRDELSARLANDRITTQAGQLAPCALEVTSPAQLFRTSAFREGWFEMQDEASQLITEIVAPPPGGLVIDACAGAGGKTLGLAALMQNKGTVIALDSDARRLTDLRQRVRRAGADNTRSIRVPTDSWPAEVIELIGRAHRILIDAPCSGLGSLRRNPDMRWRFSEDEIDRLRTIQLDLLERCVPLLRPRARIIYATCTVLAHENESVVDTICERHPELERVSIVEILGGERGRSITDASGNYVQTLPHRHGTDGFFAAVLRKRQLSPSGSEPGNPSGSEPGNPSGSEPGDPSETG